MSENIIKIDTGVVTKTFVTTDGKECEFAFNPLDMGLSRRLFSAFEKLDKTPKVLYNIFNRICEVQIQ